MSLDQAVVPLASSRVSVTTDREGTSPPTRTAPPSTYAAPIGAEKPVDDSIVDGVTVDCEGVRAFAGAPSGALALPPPEPPQVQPLATAHVVTTSDIARRDRSRRPTRMAASLPRVGVSACCR
jgi:hypothetical protein